MMDCRQNQHPVSSSNVCPDCGGVGWILYPIENAQPGARRCPRCRAKRRLCDETGIPLQFATADLKQFDFNAYDRPLEKLEKITRDFLANFESRWEKESKGIYVWSETPGSGKTFLAAALARSVMVRFDLQMRFVTAPDYLAAVGESYKRERGTLDETNIYRSCRLLVLDDIGSQKTGEWQDQELFRLVNERLKLGLVTLFTSNMPPEKLNVHERLTDRIMKSAVILHMPEVSIRRKLAEQEQAEFLKKILL